eukprot:gene5174-5412_t
MRGLKGLWRPGRLLQLLQGACDLGLTAGAGQEFWAAVQEAVLLELDSYWPAQLVQLLELMAQAGFKPEPEVLEQYLLPRVSVWFTGSFAGQQGLKAQQLANVIRSMGSIADSAEGGAVSGALVAELLSGAGGGTRGAARSGSVLPRRIDSSGAASDGYRSQHLDIAQDEDRLPSGLMQQQQLLPPEAVVESLLNAVEPQLKYLWSRAMAMLVWGVRKMGYQPNDRWVNSYHEAVMPLLPNMAPHEVAIVFSSLVHMNSHVAPQLLAYVLKEKQKNQGKQQPSRRRRRKLMMESVDPTSRGGPAGSTSGPAASTKDDNIESSTSHPILTPLDMDRLIDQAREHIGAQEWWHQHPPGQQQQQDIADHALDMHGPSSSADMGDELDPAVAVSIAKQLDIIQELVTHSG